MAKITINDREIEVENGTTILEAAKKLNISIPSLCHLKLPKAGMINDCAGCRVCVVEVEGRRNLVPSCSTKIVEGMKIKTSTKRAIKARRTMVELILSDHPADCLICPKSGKCELQTLANELPIRDIKYTGKKSNRPLDISSLSLVRDLDKCILCGRCETVCNSVQTVGVYSKTHRGFNTVMTTAFDNPIIESPCTFCGQCVSVCPTGALTQVDNTKEVWEAINDSEKVVIVQTAPAIRVALGEMFDIPSGSNVTGKMVTALRKIGFDKVFDTNFAADLTVVEETKEFLDRVQNGGKLPILTSCCPAWVNFIEFYYPDLLDIPSSCKSPHEMFGAIAKTYLAEKLNIDPKNMVIVSVMPCLAKKYEAARSELSEKDLKNVDYVITTKELSRMIKEAGLDFTTLEDEKFDEFMGESSGASVIFGTTGGVIEAVVRNASYLLSNEKLPKVDFKELRGMTGLREATVNVAGTDLKIAIANGLGNARALLEKVKNKEVHYDAIEIMACPSGCINGGGQPSHLNHDEELLAKRAKALYQDDLNNELRISSLNPEIQKLYKEYLGEPGGELAHKLLHTHYKKREVDTK